MYKLSVVNVILQRFREPRKRIQVVAGPRQVGKTTSGEQALAEYIGGYTYKLAEGLGLSPNAKSYLIGGQGMSLEEAFAVSAAARTESQAI